MHARKQRFQILKKEVKDVQMERKQAENKIQTLKNRVTGIYIYSFFVQYIIVIDFYRGCSFSVLLTSINVAL